MKLTINSKDILKALQTVGGLIKPQNTMPILDFIFFDLQPGKLFLTADNLEVRSTVELTVDFEQTHQVCIPFAMFTNILKGFPNAPVDLIFNEKNVQIKSATGEYKIPINPADVGGFPVSQKSEADNAVVFNSVELVEAVKKSYQFSDKSNADSLSTVLLWIEETGTRVVGCTKHIFYENSLEVTGPESKLLLSLSTAQYLTSSVVIEEDMEVRYGGNHIYFKLEGREISALLYDGKYPNYEVMFNKIVTDKSYLAAKEDLLPALKRIINITDKNSYAILFNFTDESLDLTFKHVALSLDAKESLKADYKGEPLSIGLNAYNVNSVLSSVDGLITMEFSKENLPCLLKADGVRCLLTPMNL